MILLINRISPKLQFYKSVDEKMVRRIYISIYTCTFQVPTVRNIPNKFGAECRALIHPVKTTQPLEFISNLMLERFQQRGHIPNR